MIPYARSRAESVRPSLWDGLVGAWMPMFGFQDDVVRDLSGRGNTGDLQNGASWNIGGFPGSSIEFGANDLVYCGTGTVGLFDLSSPWTIVCYTHWDTAASFRPAMSFTNSATDANEWVGISIDSSTDLKVVTNGESPGTGSTLSLNQWYMVGVQWDGTDLMACVDGVVDYSVTPTGSGWQGSTHTFFGHIPDLVWDHDGAVGGGLVWDRQLSTNELRALSNDWQGPFRRKPRPAMLFAADTVTLDMWNHEQSVPMVGPGEVLSYR